MKHETTFFLFFFISCLARRYYACAGVRMFLMGLCLSLPALVQGAEVLEDDPIANLQRAHELMHNQGYLTISGDQVPIRLYLNNIPKMPRYGSFPQQQLYVNDIGYLVLTKPLFHQDFYDLCRSRVQSDEAPDLAYLWLKMSLNILSLTPSIKGCATTITALQTLIGQKIGSDMLHYPALGTIKQKENFLYLYAENLATLYNLEKSHPSLRGAIAKYREALWDGYTQYIQELIAVKQYQQATSWYCLPVREHLIRMSMLEETLLKKATPFEIYFWVHQKKEPSIDELWQKLSTQGNPQALINWLNAKEAWWQAPLFTQTKWVQQQIETLQGKGADINSKAWGGFLKGLKNKIDAPHKVQASKNASPLNIEMKEDDSDDGLPLQNGGRPPKSSTPKKRRGSRDLDVGTKDRPEELVDPFKKKTDEVDRSAQGRVRAFFWEGNRRYATLVVGFGGSSFMVWVLGRPQEVTAPSLVSATKKPSPSSQKPKKKKKRKKKKRTYK